MMVNPGDTCRGCMFFRTRQGDIPNGLCFALPPSGDRMGGGARPGVADTDQACALYDNGDRRQGVPQATGTRAMVVE